MFADFDFLVIWQAMPLLRSSHLPTNFILEALGV